MTTTDELRTASYQDLLSKMKELAAQPRPSIFGLTAEPDPKRISDELLQAHMVAMAIASAKLLYDDYAWKGVDPDLAKLIVLALLLIDEAPINGLKDELLQSCASVVESRLERSMTEDAQPTAKGPVTLFSGRMYVDPIAEAESAGQPAEDTAPLVAMAGLDLNKWFSAMATQGAA